MKLYEALERQLKKEPNFVTDNGELKKWVVLNKAQNFDEELITLLLKDETLKQKFFRTFSLSKGEVVTVFNQNLFAQFLEQKNYLNDSYTQYKNKVGLTIDGKYLKQRNEVALVWPFKDCILEGGQSREEDKREEIFFNEILAQDEITQLLEPKVLTNAKRIDKDGEKPLDQFNRNENHTITDNLIIKGNNLLALHTLKEEFAGKVKLIYIDPPYNTGKDSFNYNDNFKHSSWLTFMKNRLEIAKQLLDDKGVLIVQSDDKEQAYLKVLLDEVMRPEQFETSFYVQVRYGNKTLSEDNDFQKVMEIAHVYSKNTIKFKPNKIKEDYGLDKFKYEIKELESGEKINIGGKEVEIFKEHQYEIKEVAPHINGLKETWATGSLIRQGGTAAEFLSKYLIERKQTDGLKVLYKVYGMGEDGLGYRYISGPKKDEAFRGKFYSGVPASIRTGVEKGEYQKEKPIPNFLYNFLQYESDFGNCRHEGGVDIEGGKKPEMLLSFFIEYFTKPNEIVLDYHLGSGTTCAAAHKMNRQYIGVEQLDFGQNDSVVRLKNVINSDSSGISTEVNWKGGGSFVYLELKKYNQTFIEQIEAAKDGKALLKVWEQMKTKSFLNYNVDIKKQDEHLEEFKALSLAEQKQHLCELLDKNQLYVNLSSLNDADFACTEEEKKITKDFYQIKK
ncbi:MAG TPA: site-specific DNA-methyltransferase [bacterium]|nr:site-specific DNA-methyltransferase [bacterium]HNH28795.1 site-specific DNA-methyltransferase [bacterium]HNH34026.1 site-specific DNA-methyltransferase [bacterium]